MVYPQKYKILFLSKYKIHKAPIPLSSAKNENLFLSRSSAPVRKNFEILPLYPLNKKAHSHKKILTFASSLINWFLQKQTLSKHMILLPLLLFATSLSMYLLSYQYEKPSYTTIENPSIEVISQSDNISQLIKLEHQPDHMISLKNIDDLGEEDLQQKPINPTKEIQAEFPLVEESQKYVSHLIRRGDTLWSISKEYHISIDSILSKNNMHPMALLKPGSSIKIPSMQGIYHKVRPYDTLAKIASTYKIIPQEIKKYNKIDDHVVINSQIFVPNRGYTEEQRRLLFGSFFSSPTKGSITSGYGFRRHPILGEKLFHSGIDIAAPKGFLVHSAASGTVLVAGSRGGYGNCVVIKHKLGYETLYAHLDSIAVFQGNKIQKGELIGTVGNSGNATGPHLHFEIKQNGRYLNPKRFVRIPSNNPYSKRIRKAQF